MMETHFIVEARTKHLIEYQGSGLGHNQDKVIIACRAENNKCLDDQPSVHMCRSMTGAHHRPVLHHQHHGLTISVRDQPAPGAAAHSSMDTVE